MIVKPHCFISLLFIYLLFVSGKVLVNRGDGAQSFLVAVFLLAKSLLSSSLPLDMDVTPHPFLDEFWGSLVLRDHEQLHSTLLIGGKAAYLTNHVLHGLGVLGRAPAATTVTRLAHLLGHLLARVEAYGHGVVLSCGRCPSVAASAPQCFISISLLLFATFTRLNSTLK